MPRSGLARALVEPWAVERAKSYSYPGRPLLSDRQTPGFAAMHLSCGRNLGAG